MYQEEDVSVNFGTERESLYFSIINDCEKIINEIRGSVSIILTDTPKEAVSGACVKEGSKTPLERRLIGLYENLTDLKKSIRN